MDDSTDLSRRKVLRARAGPSAGLGGRTTTAETYAGASAFLSPGSKIEVIPGTGHFFHVEKPAAVNRLIVDWVTGQP